MWLVRKPVWNLDRDAAHFFGEDWNWPAPEQNMDAMVWSPRVDVHESENEIVVHADMPGVDKKDLQVKLENSVLTIKGFRKYENEKKDQSIRQVERAFGTFQRSFTISEKVKSDEIKADYRDGVLTVTLPKAEEAKPREISIQ
jgi:HSP20 family protein